MHNKLEGFPTVYYTSLEEREDRRRFMDEQFDKYGIIGKPFITKKITEMEVPPQICGIPPILESVGIMVLGSGTTHLRSLRHWYDNTNEEMAIFCEDDHDFSTIDNWNFTWKEFLQSLPENWECIQLIRILHPLQQGFEHNLKVDIRYGRFWGSFALMKRSWVKKILDRHIVQDNIFRMEIDGGIQPLVENILFLLLGEGMYNIPLFTENTSFEGTVRLDHITDEQYLNIKIPHRICELLVKDYWRLLGHKINIQDVMRNII